MAVAEFTCRPAHSEECYMRTLWFIVFHTQKKKLVFLKPRRVNNDKLFIHNYLSWWLEQLGSYFTEGNSM